MLSRLSSATHFVSAIPRYRMAVDITFSQGLAVVIGRELALRHLEVKQFSARAGLPNATVARKLAGESKFSVDDLPALAHGLGWSMEKLTREARKMVEFFAQDPGAVDALTAREQRILSKRKG